MRVKCIIFLIPLLLVYLLAPAFADQYFTNIKEDLPYEYSFSQKYIVAGEKVLNLTVSNNTAYNIKAIEFEIRLKNGFEDIISDWVTFTSPDLQIPAHTSASLSLTLTKRSILGAKIENVLDQAQYIDLRYKRILLDDGVLFKQRDLYPKLRYNYGPFRVELRIINNESVNDLTDYNFSKSTRREDSIAYNLSIIKKKNTSEWSLRDYEDREFHYMGQITSTFSKDCLILLVTITNISDVTQEKEWLSGSGSWLNPGPPLFILVDDKKHQYNNPDIAFIPSGWWKVAQGSQVLCPNVTFSIIYVFDKPKNYTPKELKVYVDEQEYYKTFLRKDDKYIADNE